MIINYLVWTKFASFWITLSVFLKGCRHKSDIRNLSDENNIRTPSIEKYRQWKDKLSHIILYRHTHNLCVWMCRSYPTSTTCFDTQVLTDVLKWYHHILLSVRIFFKAVLHTFFYLFYLFLRISFCLYFLLQNFELGYLSSIWYNFLEIVDPVMLFNFVLVCLYNYVVLNFTDESHANQMCVLRIKS